ncbi:hypothetical protein O3M35_010255 [Rhynocoris fuscipes]|uniref:Uncharacterized protein n=1 Tax=Rhynocoris fuscipes TaxID=488301 RepID=A0AAW1CYJ7_9HEMI
MPMLSSGQFIFIKFNTIRRFITWKSRDKEEISTSASKDQVWVRWKCNSASLDHDSIGEKEYISTEHEDIQAGREVNMKTSIL